MTYKLKKEFDNDEARYSFTLYERLKATPIQMMGTNILGQPNKIKPKKYFDHGIASGNLAWAKRIAKHYGIEVPK